MTFTPNRCCILIFLIGITFVILKSAYSGYILYPIHVIIDAILFVRYMIFLIFSHHLSLFFLRYITYNWESEEDGVQPCDCPTIYQNALYMLKLYELSISTTVVLYC